MASSSDEALDESFPEMVYECSSLIDETNGKKEDPILKCPLCNHFSRCFYCVDCVKSGNFTHSQKKCFDRFADKKPKKYNLDEEKNEIVGKYAEILAKRTETENIRFSIIQHREKISLLNKSIEARKKEIEKDARNKKLLQEKSIKLKARKEKLHQKISKLKELHALSESKRNEVATKLSSVQSAFETKSQSWICELRNSIFTIDKTLPYDQKNKVSSEEQCTELEEALKTTYVQGQWVIAGSPVDNFQYAVVGCLVPSTGDYSSYTDWCAIDKDKNLFDPKRTMIAFGISSGLAYASQLVNVLAYYLDVHLPKISNINDFCQYEDVSKFHHQVAKLNANIIHLCLQRQVDIYKLSAHRTISNLQLVFDPQAYDSLQALSLQEKEDLLESLEDSICKDLLPGEDSDVDIEADFEYITNDEVPQADSPPAVVSLCLHENQYEGNIPEQSRHLESENSDSESFSDFEFISVEEVLLYNPGNENTAMVKENSRVARADLCGPDQNIRGASNSEEVPDIFPSSAPTLFSSVVTSIYRAAIGKR